MVKVVYLGSSWFSSYLLEKIVRIKNLSVTAVVTSKPSPVGRKKIITPTLVERTGRRHGLPVFHTVFDARDYLRRVDLGLVFAIREIIKPEFLNLPKLGLFNLHPSLLPYYRGASPVAFSLFMGETETGVTLIKLDERLDHGPTFSQKRVKILSADTRIALLEKLSNTAFILVKELVERVSEGKKLELTPQNHKLATYTTRLVRENGFISYKTVIKAMRGESIIDESEFPILPRSYAVRYKDVQESARRYFLKDSAAEVVYDFFRGLHKWPGLWTLVRIGGKEKRVKILEMRKERNRAFPIMLQLEGKKPVPYSTFVRAYGIFPLPS